MSVGYLIFVWDILSRPHYICAVLSIIFVQYRSVILNFVYTAIKDGIMQTFFNLILNLADLIRGYYHMLREIVRGLSQNYVFSVLDESYGKNYAYPSLRRESKNFQNYDTTNVPSRNDNNKRHPSCGAPPPLVAVRNSTIYTEDEIVSPKIGASSTVVATGSDPELFRNEMAPLEPAFANKDDYPPGWLVYHPILGISSVKEADQYDEQQT